MENVDIWRSAAQMIHLYAGAAEVEASGRASARADVGDTRGCRTWGRIADAIGYMIQQTGTRH